MEAMLLRVFKVTTLCMDTRTQSFLPLVNGLIHDTRMNSPAENDFFDILQVQ